MAQQSSFTYHEIPPPIVKFEVLEQLVSYNRDQVSSQLQPLICDAGRYQMFDLDQIFWYVCNQIEYNTN